MKTQIAKLLSAGLLVASIQAHATVNFTTDTATDLVGTFSVTGTAVDSAVPSVFNFGLSYCAPVRASRGMTATVALQCAGTPDDPRATLQNILAGAQSSGSVSGAVSSLAGSAVPAFYFAYANLHDTGGAGGTFSGSFCFSRSSTACPSSRPDPQPATLAGFYPPVEPPSVATNNAKAGQTIPLRFYAQTASGPITNLTSANLTIIGVACTDVSTAADAIDEYSTDASVALENLGGGYYQYNWKTRRGHAGTCKTVTLSLPSMYATPTNPSATFKFF